MKHSVIQGVTEIERGLLAGVLIGEGSFGGDGRQAQITLRMHSRHEPLFRWLLQVVPGSKLYGPYNHSGRDYFQWMARGEALALVLDEVGSLLDIDPVVAQKADVMIERYRLAARSSNSLRITSSTEIS